MADDPEAISVEEELRRLLRREPFHSIIIKLTSGDRYEIEDPQAMAIGSSTIVIMHPKKGSTFIRKSQIAAVDAAEPAS